VVSDVEGEILTHYGQTNKTNVGLHKWRSSQTPLPPLANPKRPIYPYFSEILTLESAFPLATKRSAPIK